MYKYIGIFMMKLKNLLTFKVLCTRPQQITVPYDIADLEKGTVITIDELFERIFDYESRLEDEHEEATSLIDNLRAEIDDLHYNIEEFYKPVDPYEYNGIRRSDFY